MNIAREILEKHLNKDLDIKTYLKGSALTYEVVLDAMEEAINYTRCCETFTPTEILKVLDDCNSVNDAKQYYLDENI
jgi:hypothetical protein